MASNETSKYKLSVVEGTELKLSLNAAQGPAGPANTLSIGTVTTAETGVPAAASITGAAPTQTLNLTLPKGNTGNTGTDGADALWNYTGEYNVGASYAVGDVATYNGETFYRIDANGGNTGNTPSDASPYWDLLAAKGVDGSNDLPLAGGAMDTGAVITLDIAPDGNGFSTDSEVAGWGFGVQQKENGVNTNVLSYVDIYGFHADDPTTSTSTDLSSIGLTFDNGSSVRKGTTDAGLGGNKGVALRCSLDYELKWDAGRLYTMEQDGFTIRRVDRCRNIAPANSDDSTKGFVVGSIWTTDDGISYICTSNTTGNAVWNLYSPELPIGQWVPLTPEPVSQNVVALEIQASGIVTEGQPIPEDIDVIITFDNPNDNPISYTLSLTEGTVFNSTTIAASLASGLDSEIELLGTQSNTVYSYNNFVAVNNGSSNFDALSSTTLTCNYGTASAPANLGAGGVIQYCTFIPYAVGQFIFESYYGSRQWVCSNVIPIIWTEITKEAPVTVSSSTDILTVGASNNLTFSLGFGDGIIFDNPTNTISCNTNVARRAGNQTFTGNNSYGTSIVPVTTTFFGTQTFNGSRTLAGDSTFSGQVELTGQALTNGTSAVTRDLGDIRYGTTYVGVNENNVSSTDNTPITLASVTLPIGRYQIESCISATSASSAGGFNFGLRSSSAIKATLIESYGNDNAVTLSNSIGSDNQSVTQRSIGTGTSYRRLLTGIIDIVTANTVVSIEFCQNTTNVVASTTRKRAYITARKIA